MNPVGALILVVAVLGATVFALWRRHRDGRLRAMSTAAGDRSATQEAAAAFPVAELGIELGRRATLVQFSTAFCQPCRATRSTLLQVAEMVDGVVSVEVDAESHLDQVRALNILRTPTVFVLDAGGTVRQRAVGAPRKADVIAAVGALDGAGH